MKTFPHEAFEPSRSTEEALSALHRRARLRRGGGAVAILVTLLVVLAFLWPKPPGDQPNRDLRVQRVWSGEEPVRYTLLEGQSGNQIIILHKEVHS